MVSTATNEGNHIYPWIPSTAIAMRLCDDTPTHCEEYCNQEDDGPDSSTSSEASSDSIKPSDIHMFSASSTLHGFKHIFAPHHSSLRRFSWVVSFIASLIFLIFQVSFKKSIACPIWIKFIFITGIFSKRWSVGRPILLASASKFNEGLVWLEWKTCTALIVCQREWSPEAWYFLWNSLRKSSTALWLITFM